MAVKGDKPNKRTWEPSPNTYLGRGVEQLGIEFLAEPERPMSIPGCRYRASYTTACAREIAYKITDTPQTNPPDAASALRMTIGRIVHDHVQGGMTRALEAEGYTVHHEVAVKVDDDICATADTVIETPNGRTISREDKSTGGFAFKKAATRFQGGPEGPKWDAVVQGALAAKGLGADLLVIGNIGLEPLAPDLALDKDVAGVNRISAEWQLTPEEYGPIADAEIRRVHRIINIIDESGLGARAVPRALSHPEFPTGARVTDPGRRAWELRINGKVAEVGSGSKGGAWCCAYCRHFDQCVKDGE